MENIPIGQKLAIGPNNDVILVVSDIPHTGCSKFSKRFGKETTLFINNNKQKNLRLRGINTRVIKSGHIKQFDPIKKIK